MPPAARITDFHTCPMVNPGPVPHVGGPIIKGAPTVLTGYLMQARVGDTATCVGPPDVIVKGSPTVIVCGSMAARQTDMTAHGGIIVVGLPTVIIGEAGFANVGVAAGKKVLAKPQVENKDADQVKQAETMIAAFKEGKPFVQQCQRGQA